MTRGTLLLLTGARSLDPRSGGTAASEAWAAAIMWRVVGEAERGTWVMTGKCRTGPDEWARPCVGFGDGLRLVEYDLSGIRFVDDVRRGRWRRDPGPCVDPHERNAAMVTAALRAQAAGWDVRVLALLSAASKTHGARRTADRAQAAGLRVARHEWAP